MKLDDLRARLRATPKHVKPKKRPARAPVGTCKKCGRKRQHARLTDPDVVEVLAQSSEKSVVRALRCRNCGIVWLATPIDHELVNERIRPVTRAGALCTLCKLEIPKNDYLHFFSGFSICAKCARETIGVP